MAVKAELTLSRVGFDPVKEAERIIRTAKENPSVALGELRENLSGFEREQLRGDLATYYPYFILNFQGKRRIFSTPVADSHFLVRNQIDKQERGGGVIAGWDLLEEELAKEKPLEKKSRKTFLWISPRGRAGEEGEYQNITFPHHQVYLGTATESGIETWALKCDVEEKFLKMWLESLSPSSQLIDENSIPSFLTSPLVSSSIDSPRTFLEKLGELMRNNGVDDTFHITEEGGIRKKIKMEEVLKRMEEAKKTGESNTVKNLIEGLTDDLLGGRSKGQIEERLTHTYFTLMRQYQDSQGNVQLKGCAGTINLNLNKLELNTTLFLESSNLLKSTFSTSFRMNGAINNSNSSENKKTLECTCPNCKQKVKAEVANGKIHCPSCGASAEYQC